MSSTPDPRNPHPLHKLSDEAENTGHRNECRCLYCGGSDDIAFGCPNKKHIYLPQPSSNAPPFGPSPTDPFWRMNSLYRDDWNQGLEGSCASNIRYDEGRFKRHRVRCELRRRYHPYEVRGQAERRGVDTGMSRQGMSIPVRDTRGEDGNIATRGNVKSIRKRAAGLDDGRIREDERRMLLWDVSRKKVQDTWSVHSRIGTLDGDSCDGRDITHEDKWRRRAELPYWTDYRLGHMRIDDREDWKERTHTPGVDQDTRRPPSIHHRTGRCNTRHCPGCANCGTEPPNQHEQRDEAAVLERLSQLNLDPPPMVACEKRDEKMYD
jgi:hypothetical protein